MKNYIKFSVIVLFVLQAMACAREEETSREVENVVDQQSKPMQETASDAVNEAMSAAEAVMDDAEGQVGEIVEDAETMAKDALDDAMDEVENMNEEELKEQALKKLGVEN